MKARTIVLAAPAAILLLAGGPAGRAGHSIAPLQAPGRGDSLTLREHFTGILTYRTASGATRPVTVTLRQWSINPGTVLSRFPDRGVLVVQLAGGDVTTVIDGERRERRPDEFWTVPGTATMRVEVGRDQAVLDVLAIQER